jgi:hypothetical protein
MPYAARVVSVFALAALVAAPAYAFGGGGAGGRGKRRPDSDKAENAQKMTKERESAYKNALKSIPDGKPDRDPWKGAR